MSNSGPRIMISALMSGSGKTLVSCALIMALKNRGLKVRAGKCGPDYIDPMYLREASGSPVFTADPFFEGEDLMKELYLKQAGKADITLIEGVMGYYDGLSFEGTVGSSYECAGMLDCPVILVVNARGMSYSLMGILKGMLELRQDSGIKGVILNNISKGTYEKIAGVIKKELGINPLGYLPLLKDAGFGSRHLGLVTPEDIEDMEKKLEFLGEEAEKSLDIDGIIALAGSAPVISSEVIIDHPDREHPAGDPVKIAVARDRAFSFYYEENLELLREFGASPVFFSPISDSSIPEDAGGLILGGGYPELYAEELSGNQGMKESIRSALDAGLPCLAECGGFMYLGESIEDADGREFEMTGFIRGMKCLKTGKLQHFGYVTLAPEKENPYLLKGETIRGHEFHYWKSTDNGDVMMETKPSDLSGKNRFPGMHFVKNTLCGFPHLFYYSNRYFIRRFVELCRERAYG